MFAASKSGNALASGFPIASVVGFDGINTDYQFGVYPIGATPSRSNAVYMFCKIEFGNYVPLYIGRAVNLYSRLTGHERRAEAIRLGATHLLVHAPRYGDRVHYQEAERRLIAHYNPALNSQHRTLF